jgi:hypothetical protein
MADEIKKVLFRVEIDTKASTQAINELSTATKENTEVIKKTKEAIQAEEGSIKALREENKRLTEQRNNVSTLTEAGRLKLAQLNAELDKNNVIIKANVDAYTKQKIGIGNYTEGIINAIPGMKGMTGGINGISAAMKANPVGLLITAFLTLKELFSRNAEVADQLSFIMSGLTKGIGFVIDSVVKLAAPLGKLFTDPKQAGIDLLNFIKDNLINRFKALGVIINGILNLDVKQITNGVLQLGTGVENVTDKLGKFASGLGNAAKEGYNASAAMDEFTESQAAANQEIKIAEIRVAALEKSLKDRTKTEKERIQIANQVADLEVSIAAKREELAKKELANESLLLKGKTLSGEEKAKLKDLETEVFAASEEAKIIAAQRSTRINILLAKEEAGEKIKQIEIVADKVLEVTDAQFAKDLERIEAARKAREDYTAEIIVDIDEEEAAKDKAAVKDAQRMSDRTKEVEKQNGNVLKSAMALSASLLGLGKADNAAKKVLGGATIATNAGIGISEATKAGAGKPWPANLAAILSGITAVLTGISQAKSFLGFADGGKIPGFAGGGLSGTRIMAHHGKPIRRGNGDNLLATVRTGEVILNEQHQRMLGGPSTFASIGVPGFANSGLVGGASTQSSDLQAVVDAITNQPRPILVLSDAEAKQAEINESRNRAVVI